MQLLRLLMSTIDEAVYSGEIVTCSQRIIRALVTLEPYVRDTQQYIVEAGLFSLPTAPFRVWVGPHHVLSPRRGP